MTSLVAYAVGLCAQRALKGATLAADRVYLEPTAPFDVDEGPCLALYCEAGRIETGQGPLLGGAGLRLRIEAYLGATLAVDGVALDNARSSALSAALIWRQIARALWAGDKGSWGDLFAQFAGAPLSVETLFDVFENAKTNARVDMRGLVLTLGESLGEPSFGLAPQGLWAQWLDALRADGPELAGLADLIARAIAGAPLPDWRAALAARGDAAVVAPALGLDGASAAPAALSLDEPALDVAVAGALA